MKKTGTLTISTHFLTKHEMRRTLLSCWQLLRYGVCSVFQRPSVSSNRLFQETHLLGDGLCVCFRPARNLMSMMLCFVRVGTMLWVCFVRLLSMDSNIATLPPTQRQAILQLLPIRPPLRQQQVSFLGQPFKVPRWYLTQQSKLVIYRFVPELERTTTRHAIHCDRRVD